MEIHDKFQSELKWGSYYFITSLIFSFAIAFVLGFLVDRVDYWIFYLTVPVYLLLFIYFLIKCIQEIRAERSVNFLSKLGIALRVYVFHSMLALLFSNSAGIFIIPKREIEIQETNETEPDTNTNSLKDLVAFIKTRFT